MHRFRHRRADRHRALRVLGLVVFDLARRQQVVEVGLPQLFVELSMNVCAVRPLAPPRTAVTDRASGYAVSSRKPVGDRMRRVVRGHRHRLVGADQLAHAAGVDDDVVADVDAPLLANAMQVVSGAAPALSGGSISSEQLAAACEVLAQRVDLRRQEVRRRARRPRRTVASAGTSRCLRQHERLDLEVVRTQAGEDRAVAGALAGSSVSFSPWPWT